MRVGCSCRQNDHCEFSRPQHGVCQFGTLPAGAKVMFTFDDGMITAIDGVAADEAVDRMPTTTPGPARGKTAEGRVHPRRKESNHQIMWKPWKETGSPYSAGYRSGDGESENLMISASPGVGDKDYDTNRPIDSKRDFF